MVKKIRLIEDEKTADELDQAEYQAKMLEYQQAIDWKLWEMLKISQAWAVREGLIEPEVTDSKRAKSKPAVKSVIVDEGE
jgi:hypothetical protein